MDCQKLIVYGIVALVGLYLLQTCGIKLPFIDNFEGLIQMEIQILMKIKPLQML